MSTITEQQGFQFTESEAVDRLELAIHQFQKALLCITRAGKTPDTLLGRNRNIIISHLCLSEMPRGAAGELINQAKEDLLGCGEWIAGVAELFPNGHYVKAPAPCRHMQKPICDQITISIKACEITITDLDESCNGFVVYKAGKLRFAHRAEALEIATANGQLRRIQGEKYYQGPDLFSEDLW